MRKLILIATVLFFVLADTLPQGTNFVPDTTDCAVASAVANVLQAASVGICRNGSSSECTDSLNEASQAAARALVICNDLGNIE